MRNLLPKDTIIGSYRFKRFKTEENYDYISVGHGSIRDDPQSTVVFKHSGTRRPAQNEFNSRGNSIWITFRADDWDGKEGFLIKVQDTQNYGKVILHVQIQSFLSCLRLDLLHGRNPLHDTALGRAVVTEQVKKTTPGYFTSSKNLIARCLIVMRSSIRQISLKSNMCHF